VATRGHERPAGVAVAVVLDVTHRVDRRVLEAPRQRRQEAIHLLHDPQEAAKERFSIITRTTFASGTGGRSVRTEGPFWTIIPAMGPTTSRGHAATLLLWAFYLGAQLGSEPPERGLVATATQAACEAARTGVAELARASGTTVELGTCRELSPDDFRRHRSHGARSGTASPSNQDRDSRGAARGAPAARPPSNVRCLSRDSCAEQF